MSLVDAMNGQAPLACYSSASRCAASVAVKGISNKAFHWI